MTNLILIFTCLFSSVSFGRITDNQTSVKIEKEFLKITTNKGFHLNAQAPASAVFEPFEAIYKPTQKTEQAFTFKIVNQAKSAKLSFYVCDDKKTVCEQHQQMVNLSNGQSAAEPTLKPEAQHNDNVSLRSKDSRPTLLVFSAPWCPACIRMQTETYVQSDVQAALKKINFKKLNSDLPENLKLSEKFHVRAIPTLILLDAQGNEVYRWLDYQPAADFAKSLSSEIKKTKTTALGPQSPTDKGMMAYNALDYKEAINWLSLSRQSKDQNYKLAAEIYLSQEEAEQDAKKTSDFLQALQKGIVLSTSEIDQARWFVDWFEKRKEQSPLPEDIKAKAAYLAKELGQKLKNPTKLAQDFKLSTFGEISGFEKAETQLMRARLFSALELKAEKDQTNQQIISDLAKMKFTVAKPGQMLMAIAYLREAGETVQVEKMYQQLIQKFPASYVYYEKYARFLLKKKNTNEALVNVDKALSYPEGNQPQLYLLKARILKEMNLKEQAISIVEDALKLKEINHEKFKKTVIALNEIKNEIKK